MKVLLIGTGGREHALGWKIAQSPNLSQLFVLPANPALEQLGTVLPLVEDDSAAIVAAAQANSIDLVVIGPEAPLARGLADDLRSANIACFGPDQGAACLESSKTYMKELCAEANVPTARFGNFTDAEHAKEFLRTLPAPYVIKADGLAAGKGVIITQTLQDADQAVDDMLMGQFGAASREIVIEEFLHGEEASFFVLCDGVTALPLIAAQDHKRVGEGDTGPNTGGMGAYSPAPVFTSEIFDRTMSDIIHPTIKLMAKRGHPFVGVLFAGLMITDDGPKLIEYNVRFGDPECQVILRRMKSDLLPLLYAAATGTLDECCVDWHDHAAALIVLAANGYPGAYQKGSPIRNIEMAASIEAVEVFHAGTKLHAGQLLANGGRVLNVTATGKSVDAAIQTAYEGVDKIDWPNGFCRRDIGWRVRQKTGE